MSTVQLDAPTYEIIVSDDSKSDSSRILIEKISLMFIGEKEKKLVLQEIEMLGLPELEVNGLYFWMMIVLLKKDIWLHMPAAIRKTQIFLYLREESLLTDREKHGPRDARKMSMVACFGQVILCVNQKLYNEMGGLDERFKIAYEDVDFATRLRKQKIETKFVPDASVCHPWRTLKQEGNNWKKKGIKLKNSSYILKSIPINTASTHPDLFRNAMRGLIKELPRGFH